MFFFLFVLRALFIFLFLFVFPSWPSTRARPPYHLMTTATASTVLAFLGMIVVCFHAHARRSTRSWGSSHFFPLRIRIPFVPYDFGGADGMTPRPLCVFVSDLGLVLLVGMLSCFVSVCVLSFALSLSEHPAIACTVFFSPSGKL